MGRKGKIQKRLEELNDKANEVLENKMCGFEWDKPCIKKMYLLQYLYQKPLQVRSEKGVNMLDFIEALWDFMAVLLEKIILVVCIIFFFAAVLLCGYCLFWAWIEVAWWYLPLGLFIAALLWAVIDFIEDYW